MKKKRTPPAAASPTSASLAQHSELGKTSHYDTTYNPKRLCAIARTPQRHAMGIEKTHTGAWPFFGMDYWHHYEVSWLTPHGKPVVAIAHIAYDCHSPYLIESKSLKLYFNSLNATAFTSIEQVTHTLKQDLENTVGVPVQLVLHPLHTLPSQPVYQTLAGNCIDHLDVTCTAYTVQPHYLMTQEKQVQETLYSHLFKSNCLVTGQPDWGSIQITYQGKQIVRPHLLRYLISFREHTGFHEQCIEQIFMDILTHCQPRTLTVSGYYTRRGGIDINPYRSTQHRPVETLSTRLIRQ